MGEVITSVFNKNNVYAGKKKGTSAQLPTDIPQDPEPVTGKRFSACSVIRALAATAGIRSISLSFFYFCFFFFFFGPAVHPYREKDVGKSYCRTTATHT